MLTHRDFSAWIVSEGEPLHEYLVAVDTDANKVSCWVPSTTGKSFTVHWKDEGTKEYSCSFIYLDGFLVPGRFLFGYGEACRGGVRTGSETERPFVFAEQSNISSGGQINPDAGTIILKIRQVSIDGKRSANEVQQLPYPTAQSNMLSHYIDFGVQKPTDKQSPTTWNVKPHDGSSNRSYVTFVFRYRSREFLLSQGIMPTDDALQIPLAVKRACAINRRVASSPLPAGSSVLVTPSSTPSPHIKNNSEQMDSALQNAFSSGSAPVRPVTSSRTVSMKAPSRHGRYPGEGMLDLSATVDPNTLRM